MGIEIYCVCLDLDEVSWVYTFVKSQTVFLRFPAVYSKKEKRNENDILVKYQRPRIDFRL